ncbi:unnamed protein product [Citrullus colocynthis]|uniref:Cytochrome P450 n=1 Tax=Citrullus colocynthis TaxID=252529 RepID=A0ABP0YIH8_9ROSI
MTPHVFAHIHQVHDRIAEILSESGSNFFLKDFFLTANPSNINHILSVHSERYPKGPDFKYIFDILGDEIFNSDSDVWKERRKTTHSLVSHESFLQFLEKITLKKVMEGLVPMLESACENGLSLEFPQVPFSKAVNEAKEVILLRHVFPKML